jgi:PAS domain S-box-containing protein
MGKPQHLLGAVFMGSGIAAMHYIGMAAMRLPAMCNYSVALVAVSVALAIIISFVAITLTFNLRGLTNPGGWKKPISALAMGLAIPVMHYTGMAAATFTSYTLSPESLRHAVDVSPLGIAGIVIVTFMLLGVALFTARIDRRFRVQAMALELSEQRYRRIVETTFDAFVGIDATGLIVDWNSRAEAIFGWAKSQIYGKNFSRMLALVGDGRDKDEQLQFLLSSLQAVLLKKSMKMTAVHRNGHEFPIELSMAAIYFDTSPLFAIFVHDITEQVKMTEQLRSSLSDLENLKRALDEHAIVARTDRRGVITFANDKFCSISKYSRGELLGQDHRIINSKHHSKEFMKNLWDTIQSGQTWQGEIKNRAKDGTEYWVSTTIFPVCDADGRPSTYISIRTDITPIKRAEEELRRTGHTMEQSR